MVSICPFFFFNTLILPPPKAFFILFFSFCKDDGENNAAEATNNSYSMHHVFFCLFVSIPILLSCCWQLSSKSILHLETMFISNQFGPPPVKSMQGHYPSDSFLN